MQKLRNIEKINIEHIENAKVRMCYKKTENTFLIKVTYRFML